MCTNEQLIEVTNLTKVYKNKKAGDIIALNDVSFALPSRGMIFFLGKSGSGKSTLLNLLGGLDGYDGGDITVGGKSMKNFTAVDYDYYRNGFAGFVFQENNLFEGYTVFENVGIALDLQKQTDCDDKISDVLKAVGLQERASHKANQLSGGQKQRVAIARALVKKPKILLCDEPTGSLDAETGKEIFTLLKQISLNTLVIVVSHDRACAEEFGDRIIEIKDGAIFSDSSPLKQNSANFSESTHLKRKRHSLSVKRILQMGLRFLISCPVRLCFCALICVISFTGFGIADAVGCYDRTTALAQTMQSYGTPYISYVKQNRRYDDSYFSNGNFMGYNDYTKLKKALDGERLDRAYDYYATKCNSINFPVKNENGYFSSSHYYYFNFSGFAEIDDSFVEDYGFKLYGGYPSGHGEAVITKYVFNGFKKYGYTDDHGNETAVASYEDLIGRNISIGTVSFKVVGILDTRFDENYYGGFLYEEQSVDYIVTDKLRTLLDYGLHNLLYLQSGYYENVIVASGNALKSGEDISFAFSPYNESNFNVIVKNRIEDKKFDAGDGMWYSKYKIINDASAVIDELDYEMRFLQPLFKWVSSGMSILSVLFILYYSGSVVYEKKKELGVLRALGGTRSDILKIFLAENGVFALAVILLSTILSVAGVFIFNALLTSAFGVTAVILNYSLRQFLITAAIAVGAVISGIAIPLIKLMRAKPVHLIEGR